MDRGKALGHGIFTGQGEHAGWRFEGEFEDNCMRHGEVRMGGPYYAGWRYVGDFGDNGYFRGSGELSMGSGRRFDGEWEEGCARRGTAEESDGAVYRVAFEGWRGAVWSSMESSFDQKQSFRSDFDEVTGASWDLLPVRAHPPLNFPPNPPPDDGP
jgi:hypothetical protein